MTYQVFLKKFVLFQMLFRKHVVEAKSTDLRETLRV